MELNLNKNFTPKQVYVSICSIRKAEWPCAIAMYQSLEYAASMGQPTRLGFRIGESLICRARQNALYEFLTHSTADYLFTLDDDIEIPPNTIVKLTREDKPIIGGFYRIKDKQRGDAAIRHLTGSDSIRSILAYDKVAQVKYVSAGCMMIRRDVIETMIQAYPELQYRNNMSATPRWALYQPYIYGQEYLSEDWAFCQRARDIGFDVWADGSIKCGHYGETLFEFDSSDLDRAEIPEDETELGPDAVPDKEPAADDGAAAEIPEVTKAPAYLEERLNVKTERA